MREFNLEEALNGAPCVTRDGRKARIICSDRKDPKYHGTIIALILGREGKFEMIGQYDQMGKQINFCKNADLLIDD